MRLLSPNEIKTGTQAEAVREILRAQEINKVAQEAKKTLAMGQADFNAMLAKQRAQWVLEEEEHRNRKLAMASEIQLLESKKANALIPVSILQKTAEDLLAENKLKASDLKRQQDYTEDLADKLQDKLDAAGQKEQDLLKKELKLNQREGGIAQQEALVKDGVRAFNLKQAEFIAYCNGVNKDIEERKTTLFLKERTLIAKENTLKRTDKLLLDKERQLADERQTLAAAWDELRQRQSKISP